MLEFDVEPSSSPGHYRGLLRGKPTPAIYDVFQGLPGRKRLKDGVLFFEWSNANVEYLSLKLPEVRWSENAEAKRREITAMRETERERRSAKNRPVSQDSANFPFKTKPFDHQLKAFHLSKDLEAYGLFMEQGSGKTKVLIDNAAYLFTNSGSAGSIDTLLIIAPNGVHAQWIREQLPQHMPKHIKWKGYYHESGTRKSTNDKFREVAEYTEGLKVFAIHIDALSSKMGEAFVRNILLNNRCMLVVDESSRIKNPKAKRTKTLLSLASLAPYRRIATGTPVTQGMEDIYSQFYFLNKDILGHNSYFSFQHRYCVFRAIEFGGKRFNKISSYKNVEELTERIDGHSFRVRKEDCLDLPERFYIPVTVELTPEQKAGYQTLRKALYIEYEGQVITAALAITNMLRLQQVLSGYIPNEDGDIITIPSNRSTVALSLIEESTSKVIVWTKFKHDVRLMAAALEKAGIGFVEYTGDTPQNKRPEIIEKFREDPDIKVFLSNPKTAGTGLNLTCASTVIWYSPDYSLEDYLQANDRVHRIGQANKVTYYQLQAAETIDEKIYKALDAKKSIADIVTDIREFI